MSLTFYYSPMSTAEITQSVLAELAIPCETIQLDFKKGDTKKPDFLKINPNGKVPVLVHDGTAIWESSAITAYLGETFGVDKKLYPAAGPKRGEAMRWIAWTNVTLAEAAMRYARNTMEWTPADQRNAKVGEAAKTDVLECFRILDEALAGKTFLLGDYTLVDTHLHSCADWVKSMKFDLTPYTNVTAWMARCSARPAYKSAMPS